MAKQFLQKSAVDVKVIFTHSSVKQPIVLNEGTGITNIMRISSSDSIKFEKTVTSDTSVAVLPSMVTGSVFVHPNAITLRQVNQVIADYYTFGIPVPGQITVSSVALNFSYVIDNVVFSKPFAGYEISTVFEDVEYGFFGEVPIFTSVANIANSALGIINLV